MIVEEIIMEHEGSTPALNTSFKGGGTQQLFNIQYNYNGSEDTRQIRW